LKFEVQRNIYVCDWIVLVNPYKIPLLLDASLCEFQKRKIKGEDGTFSFFFPELD